MLCMAGMLSGLFSQCELLLMFPRLLLSHVHVHGMRASRSLCRFEACKFWLHIAMSCWLLATTIFNDGLNRAFCISLAKFCVLFKKWTRNISLGVTRLVQCKVRSELAQHMLTDKGIQLWPVLVQYQFCPCNQPGEKPGQTPYYQKVTAPPRRCLAHDMTAWQSLP